MKREDCTDYVHAIINVPTVYQPQVTSVTKHKTSNLHRVSGYIKFNGTTTDIAQNNLPVVLKVFEGNQLVEQIKIESKRRFFTHDTYPYTGNQKDYLIVRNNLCAALIFEFSLPNIPVLKQTQRLDWHLQIV